jgi:hypothetical protein
VITQRRFVLMQGYGRGEADRRALLATVRRPPGVEYVGDETSVGARGKPPYAVAGDTAGGRN